jgi:hypothetical protein
VERSDEGKLFSGTAVLSPVTRDALSFAFCNAASLVPVTAGAMVVPAVVGAMVASAIGGAMVVRKTGSDDEMATFVRLRFGAGIPCGSLDSVFGELLVMAVVVLVVGVAVVAAVARAEELGTVLASMG